MAVDECGSWMQLGKATDEDCGGQLQQADLDCSRHNSSTWLDKALSSIVQAWQQPLPQHTAQHRHALDTCRFSSQEFKLDFDGFGMVKVAVQCTNANSHVDAQ